MLKRNSIYLLLIFLALFFFYPSLFLAKAAALSGDHLEQHYPWAVLLAKSLKNGHLPYWTNAIHLGFPIAAEGQISIYYLPNLLLYWMLPVNIAYSYTSVVHFCIAGFFTFLYGRKIGLSPQTALVGAFLFLFGAGYGGAFYNITSLKTISWLPLTLWTSENLFKDPKLKDSLLMGAAISFIILAGYLQVATFTLLILCFYLILRFIFDLREINSKPKLFIFIFIAFIFGILLSTPQLYLSFKLAMQSNRTNVTEDYAYTGSLSPAAFLTFYFPLVQGLLRGNSLYMGSISVFFVLCSFFIRNMTMDRYLKIWWIIGAVSLLFALGNLSPLYVGIVKLTHFYAFRIPAKFLVYICLTLSFIGAIGFENIINQTKEGNWKALKPPFVCFFIFCTVSSFVFFVCYYFLKFNNDLIFRIGEFFVHAFIYGKSGHPHAWEIYQDKLISYISNAESVFSPFSTFNVLSFLFIMLSLAVIYCLRFKFPRKFATIVLIFLLLIDLRVFAEIDMNMDFKPYVQALKIPEVAQKLMDEKKRGTLLRVLAFRAQDENLPIRPSMNMLYGIEELGAYSPFVLKRYYTTIGRFGDVDDSNSAFSPAPDYLKERMDFLNFLGVSHIISRKPLYFPNWELIDSTKDKCLIYRNKTRLSIEHFINHIKIENDFDALSLKLLSPAFEPKNTLLLERSEAAKLIHPISLESLESRELTKAAARLIDSSDDHEKWELDSGGRGYFVVTRIMYDGWHAMINGEEVPIVKAYGLFRCVEIPRAGKYEIEFYFKPFKK